MIILLKQQNLIDPIKQLNPGYKQSKYDFDFQVVLLLLRLHQDFF